MGETRFIKNFTKAGVFTRAEARTAFRKASDIHTASALLVGELQATANAMRVNALAAGRQLPDRARPDRLIRGGKGLGGITGFTWRILQMGV